MKLLVLLLLMLCLFISVQGYSQKLIGNKYQRMYAEDKMEKIRKLLRRNQGKHDTWPSKLRLGQLFIQGNEKAFNSLSDDMPHGMMKFTKRDKIIHSVGLTAEVMFKSKNNHPYTGIFKGAYNGILRMSPGSKPEDGTIIPGFAFKFLRDSYSSANIFAMYGLTGQEDYNVLQHDMTTHIPMLNDQTDFGIKLLAREFKKVSEWPNHLGLSDASHYDEYGRVEFNIEFPFRLVFHPTAEARNSIKNEGEISEYMHIEQLEGKKFSTLFEVYAQATPLSDELQHIGSIDMKSQFITSKYGDEYLYFQHQAFEEDLKLKPEWEEAAEQLNEKHSKMRPQYFYPDIQDDSSDFIHY